MADKKNKVIVYKDWISTFDKLTDEEAGKLIKHFFQYINDLNPESNDRLITLLFEPIKQTLKRDLKAYEARCKSNTEAIEKRWNKNNTNVIDKVQTNTNEYKRIQPNTKHTDNDNDNDSDNDINKKGISINLDSVKYIETFNGLFNTKFKPTKEVKSALSNKLKDYTIDEICESLKRSQTSGVWIADKIKTNPILLLRKRNTSGECDYVGEILNSQVKPEYTFKPKAISAELPPQSIQILHEKFGLPLDWNEYETPSRSYFIKTHKDPTIRRYFL